MRSCKKKYNIEDRPTSDRRLTTDDRPTSHLAHIGKILNGHISARGRPMHFMFVFYRGVFGVGGSNGAISGFTKCKMAAAAILEN